MRITSGRFRGKILKSVEGLKTRPTSDRARQAIFNILLHAPWAGMAALQDSPVIDVFAGTGALGLEALSRGAGHAVFAENDAGALTSLRHNIAACGVGGESLVLSGSALSPPPRPAALAPRKLFFCDPPYKKNETERDTGRAALQSFQSAGWLAPDCLCIMEMAKAFPETLPDGVSLCAERDYGVARIRFLRL